jgi:hypothetical protein
MMITEALRQFGQGYAGFPYCRLVLLFQKSVHGSIGSPRTDDNTSKFGRLTVRPELSKGGRQVTTQ